MIVEDMWAFLISELTVIIFILSDITGTRWLSVCFWVVNHVLYVEQ